MTLHHQWAAAGKGVTPGSVGWYHAFSSPFEPAPRPPAPPISPVGRIVADMLAKLRKGRKDSPVRQFTPLRKQRTRREGEVTISEFAKVVGMGPREFRKAALAVGLLHTEIVVRERTGDCQDYQHTARLTPNAVKNGLGRRLEPYVGMPYDVLTPKGQDWASVRLGKNADEKARNARYEVRDAISHWLEQGKTQAEIVRLTGHSRQLVSYHARKLAA